MLLTNRQIVFERKTEDQRVLVAVNADSQPYTARFDAGCDRARALITGEARNLSGGAEMPPYSAYYWRPEG